jgi:hypothetical protein
VLKDKIKENNIKVKNVFFSIFMFSSYKIKNFTVNSKAKRGAQKYCTAAGCHTISGLDPVALRHFL